MLGASYLSALNYLPATLKAVMDLSKVRIEASLLSAAAAEFCVAVSNLFSF